MRRLLLYGALLVMPSKLLGDFFPNPLFQFMKCRLCNSIQLEGLIADCSCDYGSVDKSIMKFFSPILEKLTNRTFFKYFRVNLEEKCPFWQEDGQCMMESCSVCTCEDNEIPQSWVDGPDPRDYKFDKGKPINGDSFGWISSSTPAYGFAGDDVLGRLNMSASAMKTDPYMKYLRDTEDDDNDWTDMSEDSVIRKRKHSKGDDREESLYEAFDGRVHNPFLGLGIPKGAYVNLLQNPEQFTGYAGPSAARVWQSIQQENCFGGQDDTCVEKRVFYRLMSGLQASISTHIAQQYYYPDGRWDTNIPLFVKAVGSHPDRLNNLYFTFLFVLRAVTKAGSVLTEYPYHTGNKADDEMVKTLIRRLVKSRPPGTTSGQFNRMKENESKPKKPANIANGLLNRVGLKTELDQCRNGFDESMLFQVPTDWMHGDRDYSQGLLEKQQLKEEFKERFRNITRIMDCVTCEKCKVWGKLQILGLGTSIKILLTPEKDLRNSAGFLNRQEVIALINTLHQLTKSVSFAAHAADLELSSKIDNWRKIVYFTVCTMIATAISFLVCTFRRKR